MGHQHAVALTSSRVSQGPDIAMFRRRLGEVVIPDLTAVDCTVAPQLSDAIRTADTFVQLRRLSSFAKGPHLLESFLLRPASCSNIRSENRDLQNLVRAVAQLSASHRYMYMQSPACCRVSAEVKRADLNIGVE